MANTALTQLQDQIEAIRREAYAEGYAAAMQAIRDFAAQPASAAPAAMPTATAPQAAQATPARGGRTAPRRGPRAPAAVPASAATPPARRRGRPPAARKAEPASSARPQRGTNAKLVETVLQAIAPRAARPTEIRKTIQREQGLAIPFTSIRHALGQLEARRTIEQVANSKTWRIVTTAAAATERS